jgi:succinate-semialdehyde dehydrogenase/glutarate-semialdehyde dehydrogenase
VEQARLFIDGKWTDGEDGAPLRDRYRGDEIATVHHASRAQVRDAIAAVARAQAAAPLSPYSRFEVLRRAAVLLEERRSTIAEAMVAEAGYTVGESRKEVDRAAQTLLLSAEEAKRIHGEVVPLDGAPGVTGRLAFTVRRPLGVVCAITPFNAPLNTVAHKVGPAIAAGNGVVLKPASFTPRTAELLVAALLDAGLPPGLVALLHGGGRTVGNWLVEDPVPAFFAFTGSTSVGESIQRAAGLRRVQLELGSLSSTIVCADADVSRAVERCVPAAFRKAGQICTSIQRLYVHREVLDEVTAALAGALDGKGTGDPRDPATFIGPLISDDEADRVERWIAGAQEAGATIVSGGTRRGGGIDPTVVTDVTPQMELMCEEVFGPVVSLRPFESLDVAIEEVNATPYGLAAGIFTSDIGTALKAADRLRMGSVHVNETSNSRVDLMPYAGVKASGMGREGPRYAIEEMTEERLVTLTS